MIGISRIAKAAGRLIFMDSKFCETAEKTLTASKKAQGWKNIHKQIGDAFVKAEAATKNESFWGGIKKQITDLPKDLKKGWASKGALGKFKGIGGQIMRRLPLLFVAMEIPNIFSAFQDKGLVGGIKEIFKSGTRFATSMAGFAIGQALIPIPLVGGLIGCITTDWLISKVIGKSHTEQKEEALAQAGAAEQQYKILQQQLMANPYGQTNSYGSYAQAPQMNIPQATMTPQQIAQMQYMLQSGYGLSSSPMDQDFMAMTSGINRLNYMC